MCQSFAFCEEQRARGRPFFLRRLPDAREGSRVTKAYGAAAATSEKIFWSVAGAIYLCSADTQSRLGNVGDWILAVPRARDGRNGKDYVPPEPAQRTTRSHR